MRLTPDQKEKLVHKLNKFTQSPEGMICPVCKEKNWNLTDIVFELREFQEGNFILGGSIYPVIPMSCGNCSYTLFFNALQLGVIEQPKTQIIKPEQKENGETK